MHREIAAWYVKYGKVHALSYRVKLSRLSCVVHPKIDRKRQNKPGQSQPAGTRRGDKVFACTSGGEWPIPPATKPCELYALLLKNPAWHDFATELTLLGRI